jgi:hypothetical protein
MTFEVIAPDGSKNIIHVSHSGRLSRFADFVCHIYGSSANLCDCEFGYLDNETASYGGYSLFVFKQENIDLPVGVGNIHHARIDSAFFYEANQMVLRIKNAEQYLIKHLQIIEPKRGRKYPFVESLKSEKPQGIP